MAKNEAGQANRQCGSWGEPWALGDPFKIQCSEKAVPRKGPLKKELKETRVINAKTWSALISPQPGITCFFFLILNIYSFGCTRC